MGHNVDPGVGQTRFLGMGPQVAAAFSLTIPALFGAGVFMLMSQDPENVTYLAFTTVWGTILVLTSVLGWYGIYHGLGVFLHSIHLIQLIETVVAFVISILLVAQVIVLRHDPLPSEGESTTNVVHVPIFEYFNQNGPKFLRDLIPDHVPEGVVFGAVLLTLSLLSLICLGGISAHAQQLDQKALRLTFQKEQRRQRMQRKTNKRQAVNTDESGSALRLGSIAQEFALSETSTSSIGLSSSSASRAPRALPRGPLADQLRQPDGSHGQSSGASAEDAAVDMGASLKVSASHAVAEEPLKLPAIPGGLETIQEDHEGSMLATQYASVLVPLPASPMNALGGAAMDDNPFERNL